MHIRTLFLVLIFSLIACGEEHGPAGDPPGGVEPAAPVVSASPRLSGPRNGATAGKRTQLPERSPGPPRWLRGEGFEVVVVDADDRPVVGARVSHPKSSATTDERGRATLGTMGFDLGMPSQDRYWKTVAVHADGYVPVSRAHPWDDSGIAHFQVVERGHRISGWVVDETGRGLPGVPLVLRSPDHPAIPLTTDERGAFSTQQAPLVAATLRVSGRTYFADSVQVVAPREDLELVAWPVCVVRGHLRLTAGASVPKGLEIRAKGHRGTAYVHGTRFTLWCRPGPVVLEIGDRVYATLHIRAGETIDDVTLDLRDLPPESGD